MVERVWHALASDRHASRIRDVLFFTYALVAEIPGVAVDNDRRGLHIDDWDLAMTPHHEESVIDATVSHGRSWTLAAHPARYRVVDAVRNLDEDWWTTGGADLHAGDRVAIWKYKGSDDHRGIIAFGEVLTDPEIHDDDQTYWIDSDLMDMGRETVTTAPVVRCFRCLHVGFGCCDSVWAVGERSS